MSMMGMPCWLCKSVRHDDGIVRMTGLCDTCRPRFGDSLTGVPPPGQSNLKLATTYRHSWIDDLVRKHKSMRFADDTGWYNQFHPDPGERS